MLNPFFASVASIASVACVAFSLRWNWWRASRRGIPVLMYHKIGYPPSASRQKSLWVTPERFEWHLRYLQEKGFESATFKDLIESRWPKNPVILTFDDGYANCYTEAFPLLKKHGFRAVFYVAAQAIGRDNFWHDQAQEVRLPIMSLDNIKEMMASHMEFGSHSLTHKRLAAIDREEARKEIFESKRVLEGLLGVPMLSFAFPYGNGEDVPELVEMVFQAGYGWVLGIHAGKYDVVKHQRKPLPRIFVRGDDKKLDFILQLRAGKSRL